MNVDPEHLRPGRRCSACGLTKPAGDFHSNGPGRLRSACSECEADRHVEKRRKAASLRPSRSKPEAVAKHPLYGIWKGMHRRCRNPHDPNYGGRGITVCSRWNDFHAFVTDMGPRPSLGHTLDRADVDGPYAPDNCQWATRAEQNMNKRNTRFICFAGRELPLVQWAHIVGVDPRLVASRKALGWDDTKALVAEPQRQLPEVIAHVGRAQTTPEWADELGLTRGALFSRRAAGWSQERMLSQPLGFKNQPASPVSLSMTPESTITFNGQTLSAEAWVERLREPLRLTYAALRGRLQTRMVGGTRTDDCGARPQASQAEDCPEASARVCRASTASWTPKEGIGAPRRASPVLRPFAGFLAASRIAANLGTPRTHFSSGKFVP